MLLKELVPTLGNPLAFQFGGACTVLYIHMHCMIRTDYCGGRVSVLATQPRRKAYVDTEDQKGIKRAIPSWFLPLLSVHSPSTSPLSHPGQRLNKPPQSGGSAPQRNQWLLIKPKTLVTIRKATLCSELSLLSLLPSPETFIWSSSDPDTALSLDHDLKQRWFNRQSWSSRQLTSEVTIFQYSCLPASSPTRKALANLAGAGDRGKPFLQHRPSSFRSARWVSPIHFSPHSPQL